MLPVIVVPEYPLTLGEGSGGISQKEAASRTLNSTVHFMHPLFLKSRIVPGCVYFQKKKKPAAVNSLVDKQRAKLAPSLTRGSGVASKPDPFTRSHLTPATHMSMAPPVIC